jgi:hypothetical protein
MEGETIQAVYFIGRKKLITPYGNYVINKKYGFLPLIA